MSNESVSGLDMTSTLLWYWAELPRFVRKLPILFPAIRGNRVETPCFKEIVNHDGSPADPMDIASFVACAQLMPAQALQRSYLRSVIVSPPQWFRRDSTGEKPIPTQNVAEALSPGAIIPCYTGYVMWKDGEPHGEQFGYAADVHMYEMPGTGLSPHLLDPMGKLRSTLHRLVWSQGLLHEVGHTIVTPVLFGGTGNRRLRLPDGRVVDEYEFLMEAVSMLEGEPISHYASAYCNPDGSLKKDAQGTIHTALNEHIVEAIVAFLLGFAYQPNGDGFHPFRHGPGGRTRGDLLEHIEAFLHAEWVD